MLKYDKIYKLRMGNNPMVGATVAVAVAVEEAMKQNKQKKMTIQKWIVIFFIYDCITK